MAYAEATRVFARADTSIARPDDMDIRAEWIFVRDAHPV